MRHVLLRRAIALAILAGATSVWVSSYAQDAGTEPWKAPARAARKKNPIPADDKSIAAGKVMYTQECRACHGETGKGDGSSAKDLEKKPGDLSSAKIWDQTDGELFWKLTEGKKPMPSYALRFTDDDRWAIVNYTRTMAPKPEGK